MRNSLYRFFAITPIIATSSVFAPEASIDGILSKIVKPTESYVRAGEVVAYLDQKDETFSFEQVPVRAPVSGYIRVIYLNPNSQVKKGQKIFEITPENL